MICHDYALCSYDSLRLVSKTTFSSVQVFLECLSKRRKKSGRRPPTLMQRVCNVHSSMAGKNWNISPSLTRESSCEHEHCLDKRATARDCVCCLKDFFSKDLLLPFSCTKVQLRYLDVVCLFHSFIVFPERRLHFFSTLVFRVS